MKSIYLIGFMGSGKTSVAKSLSKKLNLPVYDTDEMIVKQYEKTIPTIFEMYGESTFREYESSVLKQTTSEDAIISTGGGIVEREENRNWLKSNGLVFFLETTWEETVSRLKDDTSRPIWNNNDTDKRKLLESRIPKYRSTANFTVKTDGKNPDTIANEIIKLIKL